MRRLLVAGCLLFSAGLAVAAKPGGDEQPPPDNTTLKFQKTLYVHKAEKGKIFAETRKIAQGDTIWRILREEYGVSEEVMVSLVDVFREVNPGVNPNNLTAGQVVRVPFKIESAPGAVPVSAPQTPGNYVVRPGDTLWKVLKNVYGVKKEDMNRVMSRVVSANKGVKDMNRLWVGQVLVMPTELKQEQPKTAAPETPPEAEKKVGVPDYVQSVISLLETMGCKVDRTGETYIPVERGRSLRLPASEFPIVSGPGGKKAVLDPGERISPAMKNSLQSTWGYATVQSAKADVSEYLAALIPALGFFEAEEGARSIPLGEGAMLSALTDWSVAPTQKDLWEGRIHLLFAKGRAVDPRLAEIVRAKGFISHQLATDRENAAAPPGRTLNPAVIDFSDPVKGAAEFLNLLGIRAGTNREVDCRLESGVTYKVKTLLDFEYGGQRYAVAPPSPAKAESILTRSGYFTFSMAPGVRPSARLGDILTLAGIPRTTGEIEAPKTGGLRLVAYGLTVRNDFLADALYPPASGQSLNRPPVFLTEAEIDPALAQIIAESGYLPVRLK